MFIWSEKNGGMVLPTIVTGPENRLDADGCLYTAERQQSQIARVQTKWYPRKEQLELESIAHDSVLYTSLASSLVRPSMRQTFFFRCNCLIIIIFICIYFYRHIKLILHMIWDCAYDRSIQTRSHHTCSRIPNSIILFPVDVAILFGTFGYTLTYMFNEYNKKSHSIL